MAEEKAGEKKGLWTVEELWETYNRAPDLMKALDTGDPSWIGKPCLDYYYDTRKDRKSSRANDLKIC